MQTVYARLVLCGALVTAAVPLLAQQKAPAGKPADEKVPAARIGEPAPDFSLLDSEGTKHTLSGFKDKLVVLEWVNQQCPFSVAAVPVMKDLQKKYHDKGIVWLGIESTHWRTPEENAHYIKEKSLGFPILMDNDGRVGRLYGAKVTPHIFIINKGTLVYAGALQAESKGEQKPEQKDAVVRNYVDEALQALLDNKPVPLAETTPRGCTVKYKPAAEKKEPAAAGEKKE